MRKNRKMRLPRPEAFVIAQFTATGQGGEATAALIFRF